MSAPALRSSRSAAVLLPTVLLAAVLALAGTFLGACGQKDKSEIPVAEVGDHVITLAYFERKMNTMDPAALPEGIESTAGKEELLSTMIDKEVMAIKAKELGFGEGGQADEAALAFARMKAVKLMKDELVKDLNFVSEEEVQDYYRNLGRVLQISYMVFDTKAQAEEARKLVAGGEDWVAVATKMKAGDPGPTGNWTAVVRYGTIVDDLEKVVYGLEVGEISQPIESIYGYNLIRVDGESFERVKPLEEMKDDVIQSVHQRNVQLKTVEFIEQVFDEYGLEMNEAAVETLYAALPPDGELVPVPPKEEWPSLQLSPKNMDMMLMKYDDEVWDLRRYYDFYEATAWLGRPRRERRLGGLRRHLKEIVIQDLMPKVAEDRGYMDRPEIQDEIRERKEQVMVGRLHRELISNDVDITQADVDTFWANNKHLYDVPETREGVVLVSTDSARVAAAYEAARRGTPWDRLIADYALAPAMPGDEGGHFGPAGEQNNEIYTPLLWAQDEEGQLCEPMKLQRGLWGIGRLETIHPPREGNLVESGTQIRKLLESRMAERLFRERVDEWRSEIPITTYPENLAQAVYQPRGQQPGPGQAPPQAQGAAVQ